jgi:hypothetical protein
MTLYSYLIAQMIQLQSVTTTFMFGLCASAKIAKGKRFFQCHP